MIVTYKGTKKEYAPGTIIEDIAKEYQDEYEYDILLAERDGSLCELSKEIKEDCTLDFVMANTSCGNSTYKRSATLIMLKAFYKIVGREKLQGISIQFSISKGYFCTINGDVEVTDELLKSVEAEMKRLVEKAIPINKITIHLDEAKKKCAEYGMHEKVHLYKYRRSSGVNMYELQGFEDYYYGYMVPNTSYIKYFKLFKYDDGFVIQLPTKEHPTEILPFDPKRKIFQALKEATIWGREQGAPNVGAVNDRIVEGEINNLMLVQEAFQEKKLAELAETISKRKNVRFIMIAGPSSSGKTTTSHRLSIQLLAKGLKPIPIPVDNYFVNREDTPKDENGELDYEVLEALDVELFNEHMKRLSRGERVELPEFNFLTGKREYHGNYLQLKENDVLVIEGIHCLNSAMSYSIPEDQKFKIYISALTQLNIDEHNRIATSDLRLLRRIVRDARTRGNSATDTIGMWHLVRRGEENNIFPYQNVADAVFNSALIYEIPVLKQYAEPLLFSVEKNTKEYYEAKRLLKFLNYFLGVPSDSVPKNSILREFIGGSCFKV
ncbi:MAG: nucleoside kinase [Lachnospiraceae bacterium]|nr:nucleoside kinase [Lachnospiraceae bacterium]